MSVIRVQVSLPAASSIPNDMAINTWHFFTSGDVGDAANQALSDLQAFYTAVDGFFSSDMDTSGEMKIYDLSENPPRAPIATDVFAITPDTGNNLPPEVAICLSYAAAAVSSTNAARRRGRIYLGPLSADVMTNSGGTVVVAESVRNAIAAAADALMGDAADPGASWCVFSPTAAGPEPWSSGDLIVGTSLVNHGFVDNAFDTIRSRGTAASARSTWG